MTDNYPPTWTSRPKRRNWRAWVIAIAATILLAAMCGLSFAAESAMLPPRPTDRVLPVPPGRHETRLYCRNFAQHGATRIECRRVGGHR